MYTEKIKGYVNDLISFNKHFQSAVRNQKTSNALNDSQAMDLFHNIDLAITDQVKELESFEDLITDSKLEQIKDQAASVFGFILGNIDGLRKDPISKMLRDNYAVLNMLAGGYTMLYTAAIADESDRLARFAKKSLKEIEGLIIEAKNIIPFVVANEFVTDAEEAKKIGDTAFEEVKSIWLHEELVEA